MGLVIFTHNSVQNDNALSIRCYRTTSTVYTNINAFF